MKLVFTRTMVCSALAVAGLGGCNSAPKPEIEERVAETTALSAAVEFQQRGRPTDEQQPSPAALTLEAAIRRAMVVDPSLQTAIARVRIAEADARQARLIPNPVLSVAFRWPESSTKPEIEAGLSADLVTLLSRPGRVSAADNRLRAAAADALSTALDVLSSVQEKYAAIQTNDELLNVLEERQKIVDRLLQVSHSRLEAGEGTRLDTLSLQSQQVELRTELAERQMERREARLALARVIGEPSGAIDWQVEPWAAYPGRVAGERAWIVQALKHRPELQKQEFELAALGAERRLAGYGVFEGSQAGIEAERADGSWAIGPGGSMPVPIFDWGQARRDKAKAVITEASHQLTLLRRQVVEEVRREHGRYIATTENLNRVRDELIPLAQQRQEQAEAQFKGGQTDITGLLQAEQESRAARTRLVELERRNSEALIRLQRAVGGPSAWAAVSSSPTTAPSTQP